jgi:hypothetical protein
MTADASTVRAQRGLLEGLRSIAADLESWSACGDRREGEQLRGTA